MKHKQLLLIDKSSFQNVNETGNKNQDDRTICNEVTQPNEYRRHMTTATRNRQTSRKSTANYLHHFDHIYWKNAHQNQRRQRTFLCHLENKLQALLFM